MKKYALLLILFWAYPVFALTNELDTYYDFGRKGSTGVSEEEDLTDEFNYQRFNVKFSQQLNPAVSYYVKYQHYDKDFDNLENLDNKYNLASFGIDTPIYSKEKFSIKFGPDFEFKEKTYSDSKNKDYDQIRFDLPLTFKKEGDWAIKMMGGINSYHYPNFPKDEFKLNGKIEALKKLLNESLELSAFYKLQLVLRQKIYTRLERTYGAVADLKVESPLVKTLGGGIENGMDNTIVNDEREDSYDFKFWSWYLRTKLSILDILRTSVKYSNLSKAYADWNHDFGGFMLENIWDVRIFEVKKTVLDFRCTYYNKQFRFPYVSNPYSLYDNNIVTEAEMTRKDNWKGLLGYETKFYTYPARKTNDKIYYIVRVGVEKYLLKKSLTVSFDYKYTFKNFLHKLDITEDTYRVRVDYKF